jgi:predicted TIM-barrel enzyme
MNTAVAGSEDEAIDMIQAGCDSIVVLGQENVVWQGIDGIVAATFADLDVVIPESEAAAFFEAVTPGMIKDVITIISGAFEAMDELSEGLS